MALTPGRWIAIVVLGCGLLVTSLALPSASNRERTRSMTLAAAVGRVDRLGRAMNQAYYRWTSLARRDSLLRALPTPRPSHLGLPAIAFDSRLEAPQRTVFERALSRHWRSLGIDSVHVPVTIAVVLDTGEVSGAPGISRRYLNYEYLIPTSNAGSCVSVVVIGDRDAARRLVRHYTDPQARAEMLGPCAFFAAFGRPGAEIDRWLRGRTYRLANNPRWIPSSSPSALVDIGDERFGAYYGRIDPNPWYSLGWSPNALACAGGALDRCAATGLTQMREPDPITHSGLVQRRFGDVAGWSITADDYLSDLATRLGPEQFEKFWRSPLPVDAALQEASGMTVPEWTHQWSVQFFGERPIGPSPGLIETIAMLLASAAGLIGAFAVAMRRQLR